MILNDEAKLLRLVNCWIVCTCNPVFARLAIDTSFRIWFTFKGQEEFQEISFLIQALLWEASIFKSFWWKNKFPNNRLLLQPSVKISLQCHSELDFNVCISVLINFNDQRSRIISIYWTNTQIRAFQNLGVARSFNQWTSLSSEELSCESKIKLVWTQTYMWLLGRANAAQIWVRWGTLLGWEWYRQVCCTWMIYLAGENSILNPDWNWLALTTDIRKYHFLTLHERVTITHH